MSEQRIWSCEPQDRTLAAQVKAFQATWIKFAALDLKLLEYMLCLKNPHFAWEATRLGVQLHLRSKAKKMHFLSFSHVLRGLLGNWAEPVWQWKTLLWLLFVAAPWSMVAGVGDAVAQPVARSPNWGKSLGSGQVSFSATSSQAETLLGFQQHVEQSRRAKFSC